MYVENLKAKIISGKNYLVKDEKGEKTDELGLMGVVLMLDCKENKPLDNKIFSVRIAKPISDNPNLTDYEKKGYIGAVNLHNVDFGQDVIISGDIPLKDDFIEQIKLYDMKFV